MIVFSGKISNNIQQIIENKRRKQFCFIFIITGLFLCACGIIFSLIFDAKDHLIKFVALGLLLIILVILICLPINKGKGFCWDYIIEISKDIIKITSMHQNGTQQTKSIKKVKRIIDYGEYYYIYFNRWDASNGIVCQKNLLLDGSLEEFEQLFNGKIKKLNY